MTLEEGDKRAAKIVKELAPFCERIEIAGSIRRRRPEVNDVDIVVLPAAGAEANLRARCKQNASVIREGPQMMELRCGGGRAQAHFQLDLWIAARPGGDLFSKTPTNFGSLLLCRTGSKDHNIWLVTHAKLMGLAWNPHWGVSCNGALVASDTEENIFKALALDFIKPEDRERP